MKKHSWERKENSLDKFSAPSHKGTDVKVLWGGTPVTGCIDISFENIQESIRSSLNDMQTVSSEEEFKKKVKVVIDSMSGGITLNMGIPWIDTLYCPTPQKLREVKDEWDEEHNKFLTMCKDKGVEWVDYDGHASYDFREQVIHSQPITDPISLSIAYHEMGHCMVREGRDTSSVDIAYLNLNSTNILSPLILEEELLASTWAIENNNLVDKGDLLCAFHTYLRKFDMSNLAKDLKTKYLKFVLLCGEPK